MDLHSPPCPPSLRDRVWRFVLRVGYHGLLRLRGLHPPEHHGALVAATCAGRVLMVRNAYRRPWSLPGGSLRRGESGAAAAARELGEELGFSVSTTALRHALDLEVDYENQHDHCGVWRLELAEPPALRADCREVVAWRWLTPPEALDLDLTPVARAFLEHHLRAGAERDPGPDALC